VERRDFGRCSIHIGHGAAPTDRNAIHLGVNRAPFGRGFAHPGVSAPASGRRGAHTGADRAPATAVLAGDEFTCALMKDGRVYCWGLNDHGQLGVPAPAETGPVAHPAVHDATSLSAREKVACVVMSGAVTCWGVFDDGAPAMPPTEIVLEGKLP